MGEVYLARDTRLRVQVAVKTLRSEFALDAAVLHRFKQEFLAARSVFDPGICRIYEFGRHQNAVGELLFLVMDYLRGETLRSRIRREGPIDADQALALAYQLADGLDAAHRSGIVHGDFKSANIMLTRVDGGDRTVITDFGLARAFEYGVPSGDHDAGPDRSVTGTIATPPDAPEPTRVAGTPTHMAPEQLRGKTSGPRGDLYALGVVLFEMATGRLPFPEATSVEAARACLDKPRPRVTDFVPVDARWDHAVGLLLAEDPESRPATAGDAIRVIEGRPVASRETPRSLPAERDVFVGRQGELDLLAEFSPGARASSSRLFTVHGPGGIGKTRLAQHHGWRSLDVWPGGVWFCDVSEALDADDLARVVATVLDIVLDRDDPIERIGHAIAARAECLVILDGLDPRAPGSTEVLRVWLQMATSAVFVITSRARLQMPEEVAIELEPLDPMTSGATLFEARAIGYQPGFRLTARNHSIAADIVRRLGGMPLAIELAAARLRRLDLAQLRDRLRRHFRIDTGHGDDHGSTLRETLDWSWDLLDRGERLAISQASVFEGGFTLDAGESVIDPGDGTAVPPVLDVLQALIDKSWLRTWVTHGVLRFGMYATVREYTAARLASSDRCSCGVETRHCAYYAGMGSDESIERLHRHRGVSRRAALALELSNLLVACRRALARGDDSLAANAFAAANAVLTLRGPLSTAVRLGNEVLQSISESGPRGRVLVSVAWAEQLAGKMDAARAHAESGLSISQRGRDWRREAAASRLLGDLDAIQDRPADAYRRYQAALAIERRVGDRSSEATTLSNLGAHCQQQGRREEARSHYEAALAVHRETGNRRLEGVVLGNLGALAANEGRLEESRECYEAALAAHRDTGNRLLEGVLLGGLGILHFRAGHTEEARLHYDAALAMTREVGARRSEATVLANLVNFHASLGDLDRAIATGDEALAIYREIDQLLGQGIVLSNLGTLCMEHGRMKLAQEYLERALTINRATGNRSSEGDTLCSLGALHAEQDRLVEARRYFALGTGILRDVRDHVELGKALCAIGTLEMRLGDVEAARAALAEAESVAEKLGADRESDLAQRIQELRALRVPRGSRTESERPSDGGSI